MFSSQVTFVIYYVLTLRRCRCLVCSPGGSFPSCFSWWNRMAICKAMQCARGWQCARRLLLPICASEIAGACAKHSLGAALLAGTGQNHDVSW